MDKKLNSYFDALKGKRVAVIGIGVSNIPLIGLLLEHGAEVVARDRKPSFELGDICFDLQSKGAVLKTGEDYLKDLNEDIIFKTPGMRYDTKELLAAQRKGSVVTSEMEVFLELCPAKIFAVTGSDGKTTTTTIIYNMLKAQGFNCYIGGNIGKPLLSEVKNITPYDMIVLELSSFQLHTMKKSPDISVITNITPNHLDMHKSMEEYINAKKNIFLHQNSSSRLVLNYDDKITRDFSKSAAGEYLFFGINNFDDSGAYLDGDDIFVRTNGEKHFIMKKSDIILPGMHNVANYLAAVAAVWGYVSPENIAKVAKTFAGVEHRIEFVRELNGVKFYNDSIASSPTRTMAALESFSGKVIVIAGGYDKKIPFEPMSKKMIEKVKHLVLVGQTSEKIEKAVVSDKAYTGQPQISKCQSFKEAVMCAYESAKPGDIVILSPACASFDLFKNFEERGNAFKFIVNSL